MDYKKLYEKGIIEKRNLELKLEQHKQETADYREKLLLGKYESILFAFVSSFTCIFILVNLFLSTFMAAPATLIITLIVIPNFLKFRTQQLNKIKNLVGIQEKLKQYFVEGETDKNKLSQMKNLKAANNSDKKNRKRKKPRKD